MRDFLMMCCVVSQSLLLFRITRTAFNCVEPTAPSVIDSRVGDCRLSAFLEAECGRMTMGLPAVGGLARSTIFFTPASPSMNNFKVHM